MKVVSMNYLLESGVHFGHQKRAWNPKMKDYIFGTRDDIYIINLEKTEELIAVAYEELKNIAEKGGKVLFVGTKKQAQEATREAAEKSDSYYVTERWLGGTLTNFRTIRKRIQKIDGLEKLRESEDFVKLPKKEQSLINKEYEKLNKILSGIRKMEKLPQALIIVDPIKEYNAIKEAKKLNIPVFGLIDTNGNPDFLDYIIPGNDDAIKSIRLIFGVLSNAVCEGKKLQFEEYLNEEDKVKHSKNNESVKTEITENELPEETKTEEAAEMVKEIIEPTNTAELQEKSEKDLNDYTLVELRQMAKEKDLKGYSAMKKAELIELLK